MNLIRVEVSYQILHDALGLPIEVGVGYVAAIGGKVGEGYDSLRSL